MNHLFQPMLLFLLFLTLKFPQTVLATHTMFFKDSELLSLDFTGYEKINPNLEMYPFKKLSENIGLMFTFTKIRKSAYTYKLYQTRFNELVYIINFNKTSFLVETVDRYNTSTGTLKQQSIGLDVLQKGRIINNVYLLEKLRDRYSSNSPYWAKIQQAVDTTKSLI